MYSSFVDYSRSAKTIESRRRTYEATESFGKALVVAPQVWLDCAEFAAPWPATQTAWTPSLRRPNAPEKDQINGKKNGKGTKLAED